LQQRHDPGFEHLKAIEEAGDLLGAAQVVGIGRILV
jgi:hypothetical protein